MKDKLLHLLAFFAASSVFAEIQDRPNVVIIYADDLGYGDVSCNGSTTISTPHIDQLAADGIRFTDGHCSSATCTPSRFSMLTGRYAFRQQGTGVLSGDAGLIIDPNSMTLADLFQQAGYKTGVVGKWHLGLGEGSNDWNEEIRPGPLEIGFDYCFLMPATGDRVPCVYFENRKVVNLDPADPIQVSFREPFPGQPTGKSHPELLRVKWHHGHNATIIDGISRIGHMIGGKEALWKDQDIADVFVDKAKRFIEERGKDPFFLFFSMHDIHVPRVPHPRFEGLSGMGPRGDCIIQFDWCVGEIMKSLEAHGLKENTLVFFSSDNGPVLNDGYFDDAVEKLGNHKPAGVYRGGKYSKFEAGTRVPTILSWPARVEPGVSDALVSQIDLAASLAALLQQSVDENAFPDSVDTLAAFLGQSKYGRSTLVKQGRGLALRQGNWKYIPKSKGSKLNRNTNIELGNDSVDQLYDLSEDPGEQTNLADHFPEKVDEMEALLKMIVYGGSNDT